MKNFSRYAYLTILLIAICSVCYAQHEPYIPPEGDGFAVLELFTAEGCYSCPAADKAMVQLGQEYKRNLYTLEFHVDYWDYLGWKDPFANPAYTARQKHYADLFLLSDIYTPQVIINGVEEVVGSDKAKIRPLLNRQILREPKTALHVTATSHISRVFVAYNIEGTMGQLLNVAVVQRKAETSVWKGENEGRILKHTNIVRYYKTIELVEDHGFVEVLLPPGLVADECSIIAYTQKKKTRTVTSADRCPITPERH